MGSVKVDIHKAERQFDLITFSDIDCIKGLIKHRSKIDSYYNADQDNHFDHAGNVKPLNQELLAIYSDLDMYLKRVELNSKQRYIVNKLMEGWTEEELAKKFNRDESNIRKNLDTICKKIKQLNDMEWKFDYIFNQHIRVPWNYKQCSRCKERKPALNEFFSLNKRSPDGFHSICKACR